LWDIMLVKRSIYISNTKTGVKKDSTKGKRPHAHDTHLIYDGIGRGWTVVQQEKKPHRKEGEDRVDMCILGKQTKANSPKFRKFEKGKKERQVKELQVF